VQGVYRVWGLQGSGFRVQGAGFRVQGAGFRVQGAGFKVRVWALHAEGFRVFRMRRMPNISWVGVGVGAYMQTGFRVEDSGIWVSGVRKAYSEGEEVQGVQGYLAHKNTPTPLRPP